MLPTKLGSFGQAVSEEKIFLGIDQSLLKKNYGSVFLTQNYELQFSVNVIITITYSTL